MLKESLLVDLRCLPEDKKKQPGTKTYNKTITLLDFINHVAEEPIKDFGERNNFFIVALFPDGCTTDIKYKFSDTILVPVEYTKYLSYKIDHIMNIIDDGGFGTYLLVGEGANN